MSELKKPTIEGLVEKLLEENHIEEKEKGTIQALLEQSTSGMDKDEIFSLVTKLNDKLDAHTSDLITPNGLNYASFDEVIKTVTKEIKRESAQRKENQAETPVETLQEKRTKEKTPQEKAEIERQERIESNKRFFDDIIKNIPELENIEIPQEISDKIAEDLVTLEDFYADIENQKKLGEGEESKNPQNVSKKKEYPFKDEKLTNMQIILYARMVQKELRKNPGKSIVDCIEDVKKSNTQLSADVEKTGIIEEMIEAGTVIVSTVKDSFCGLVTRGLQNGIMEAQASMNCSETEHVISIDMLRKRVNQRENFTRILKIISKGKKELSNEEITGFFEELTQTYLSSNKSLSILYDELNENDVVKKFDLDFDDFVEGIKNNLSRDIKGDPIRENEVIGLIKAEREIRKYDIFNLSLEKAAQNGFLPHESDKKVLEKQNDLERAERRLQKLLKDTWARRRNIEVTEVIPEEKLKLKVKPKRKLTAQTLEQDINRITKDRKQIIEISKEFGISTDEAARRYFSENPSMLESYSKSEKNILIREQHLQKNTKTKNRILNQLDNFRKRKNDQLISVLTVDIEQINIKIEKLKQEFDMPQELSAQLKMLERTKTRLKKAEERKKYLEKKGETSKAMNILDRKVKQNAEKEIFLEYINNPEKSLVEILADLEKRGNEHKFNFSDMRRIVEQYGKGYWQKSELSYIKEQEEVLFQNSKELESFRIKIKNAEKKGLDDWVAEWTQKIADLEARQIDCKKGTAEKKNVILVRMGLRQPNDTSRTDNIIQPVEESQIIDSGEARINHTENTVKALEEQEGEIRKGLAVEQIEVTGVKPDVKAIAKKSKVTPKKIKDAFSRIVGLRKAKEKEIEQTEQETSTEGKTTNTSTETVGR